MQKFQNWNVYMYCSWRSYGCMVEHPQKWSDKILHWSVLIKAKFIFHFGNVLKKLKKKFIASNKINIKEPPKYIMISNASTLNLLVKSYL